MRTRTAHSRARQRLPLQHGPHHRGHTGGSRAGTISTQRHRPLVHDLKAQRRRTHAASKRFMPGAHKVLSAMKVLHIITRLILGGAQQNTVLTCAEQVAAGHRVWLAYGPIYGPEGSLLEEAKATGA